VVVVVEQTIHQLSESEVQAIWAECCTQLQTKLTPAVFATWIGTNPLTQLELLGDSAARGVITSPTAFHANNVKKNLHTLIAQTLTEVVGRQIELEYRIGNPTAPATSQVATPAAQNFQSVSGVLHSPNFTDNSPTPQSQQPQPASRPTPPPTPRPTSVRVEDLFSQQTVSSMTVDRALLAARQAGLRRDFTFETFAVSTTNEMAHAAATAVSTHPGTTYNPLFLYGGVGVGKTHLMHAIANNILTHNSDLHMIYCTGEEFTNEIVSAIQNKKAIKFKEKFRTADVLMVDDVQFIAGKNAVQEEFFHTFNALTKQARQIILTSDRPPQEIPLLEDRIKSRFEAGLIIDIQQPTFELRTAILLIKAQAVNLTIPMDIAQTIASRVDSARKIEGMITSIRSEVELKRRTITPELIDELFEVEESNTEHTSLKVTPNDVLRAVSNHFHLKQAAVKGHQRVQELVKARHLTMYLFKEELRMPLVEIGRWFSGRDHTSALHAARKIETLLKSDELLRRDLSSIKMSLKAVSA
jgi:chromosomal replication initiator protein